MRSAELQRRYKVLERFPMHWCNIYSSFSQIRQVPDNQEVFAHLETDQSVLIELLEYSGDVQGTQAAE